MAAPGADLSEGSVDFSVILAAVRRQLPVLTACSAAGFVLALAYALLASREYTAVSTILIEAERTELLREVSPIPSAAASAAAMQNEIEIFKSHELAERVARALDLHEDERFAGEASESVDGGEVDPYHAAAAVLRRNLDVERVDRSFVLTVGYTGPDPVISARVARTYIDEYKALQRAHGAAAAEEARAWLLQKLDGIKERSAEASAALREFREDNSLVAVEGELLSSRQLSELATRLVTARGETEEARARISELEALLESGETTSAFQTLAMIELPRDEVLDRLREDYLSVSDRHETVVAEWGAEHPEAVRLASRIAEYDAVLRGEVRSAIEALRATMEISRKREENVGAALGELAAAASAEAAQMSELRRLEMASTTYTTLYGDLLRHAETLMHQPQYPIAPVRVLTPAEVPKHPSSPRKKLLGLGGMMLGGLVGAVIAFRRETGRQPLRTAGQVRRELGLPGLGLLPGPDLPPEPEAGSGWPARVRELLAPVLARLPQAARFLPAPELAAVRARASRLRTLHSVRRAIERRWPIGRPAVVEIAPLDRSDAAEFAAALAELLERNGERVHIDGAENSGLPPAETSGEGKASGTSGRRRSKAAGAKRAGQTILRILPPLIGGEPVSEEADASLLVAEWGRDDSDLVRLVLDQHPEFANRLVGVILDGADLNVARKYMRADGLETRVMESPA